MPYSLGQWLGWPWIKMLMLERALKDLHWDCWPGDTHGDSVSRALHAAGFGESSNPGEADERALASKSPSVQSQTVIQQWRVARAELTHQWLGDPTPPPTRPRAGSSGLSARPLDSTPVCLASWPLDSSRRSIFCLCLILFYHPTLSSLCIFLFPEQILLLF